MSSSLKIGFIGQGFIGKSYADDFQERGYQVVRYSIDPAHAANRDLIADCDVVFIAVPTPTTPEGFNFDTLKQVVGLVGVGKSAVVKSTILPGTCAALQAMYPDRFVFHSPEFLTSATAAYDAAHPTRNIIGYPVDNDEYRRRAEEILDILPPAPVSFACHAKEAELIKYASNGFLVMKVVFANVMYDLATKAGADWQKIFDGVSSDPRIGGDHFQPVAASGARGAGGHCFIKDFAALREFADSESTDTLSVSFLHAIEAKNKELLEASGKDKELLEGVYGK